MRPKEQPVFFNTRTMLSTVFRDSSSGKGGCVVKHPKYRVNCVQEFQLWRALLYSETKLSTLFRHSSSGKGGFVVKYLAILSTVFKDFSSGKCFCILKHPNYPVNCLRDFGSGKRGCVLKGSLTREFRLQVFFINQCPPGP
jgi:hypothetical protein